MAEILAGGLLVTGSLFVLLAAVGVVRMPDVYTRMGAATKSSTLGVPCTLLGVAVYFGDAGAAAREVATIVFLFLTAPISAHALARAAYLYGVPLWEGTVRDELRGRYDPRTLECAAPDRPPGDGAPAPRPGPPPG